MPYGNPQRRDGFAVASLIFAVCAIVPVAVALGIAALVRLRRSGRPGRDLEISALVVSLAWVLLVLAIVLRGLPAPPTDAGTSGMPMDRLGVGVCFIADADMGIPVPCGQPHGGEIIGRVPATGRAASANAPVEPDCWQVRAVRFTEAELRRVPGLALLPIPRRAVDGQAVGSASCAILDPDRNTGTLDERLHVPPARRGLALEWRDIGDVPAGQCHSVSPDDGCRSS
jgi:hypothetical protein